MPKLKRISHSSKLECLYCNYELRDHKGDAGIYHCDNHPSKVTFICSGSVREPDIQYIQIQINTFYMFEIFQDVSMTLFRYVPYVDSNYIRVMVIDYDPTINPEKGFELSNRILNMKAFL